MNKQTAIPSFVCAALLIVASLQAADDATLPREIDHVVPEANLQGSFEFIHPTTPLVRIKTTPAPGWMLIPPGDMLERTTEPTMAWMRVRDDSQMNLWEAGGPPGHRVYSLVKGKYGQSGAGGTPPDWTTMSIDVDLDGDTNCDGTANLDANGTLAESAEDIAEDKAGAPGALVSVNKNDPPTAIVLRRILPVERPVGTVSLTQSGKGQVKLYLDEKKTQAAPDNLWPLVADKDRKLYVEGVAPGPLVLTATYYLNQNVMFYDKINMTVVGIDLTIVGEAGNAVPDAKELEPGYWLSVNNDDDNGNKVLDKFDVANVPPKDDDFRTVNAAATPPPAYTVKYRFDRTSTKIEYWMAITKASRLFPANQLQVTLDHLPDTLFAEGLDPSRCDLNLTLVCNGQDVASDKIGLTAFEVKKVEYSAEPGSIIDADPHHPGETDKYRIFPDSATEDEAKKDVNHARFIVTVTVEPDVPSTSNWKIPLYIRLYDPHHYLAGPDFPEFDRSSTGHAATINDNQTGSTNDKVNGNSHEEIGFEAVLADSPHTQSIQTPDDDYLVSYTKPGQSEQTLQYRVVNPQPGNNIVAGAACSDVRSMLKLKTSGTAADGQYRRLQFINDQDNAGTTPIAHLTGGTLTVWRKLYIERDCLNLTNLREGPAGQRSIERADVVATMDVGGIHQVTLDIALNQENQYQGGISEEWRKGPFSDDFLDYNTIIANTDGAQTTITVQFIPDRFATFNYICDDDAVDTQPIGGLAFRRGAKLNCTPADTTVLDQQLRVACMEPDYAEFATDHTYAEKNINFVLNSDHTENVAGDYITDFMRDTIIPAHRGCIQSRQFFWTIYLLSMYQQRLSSSADPDTNGALWGLSYPFWHGESTGSSRGTASIFQETLRDTAHSGFGYKTKVSDQQVPPALKDIDISAKAFDKVEGERETMAHEVGHCLAGLHTDGGLMGTGEWYDTLHPFAQPIGNVGVPLPPVVGQTGQQPIFSSKLLYKIYRLRRNGP